MTKRNAAEMRFFTIREIAEQRRVSERTVSRWIATGELRVHKFGAAVRASEEDLRAFDAMRRTS
jgi:excisionase family DNA binding protein